MDSLITSPNFASGLDLPLTGDSHRFDGEQFAANFRPSKAP